MCVLIDTLRRDSPNENVAALRSPFRIFNVAADVLDQVITEQVMNVVGLSKLHNLLIKVLLHPAFDLYLRRLNLAGEFLHHFVIHYVRNEVFCEELPEGPFGAGQPHVAKNDRVFVIDSLHRANLWTDNF